MVRIRCFFYGPIKKFCFQMGKKTKRRKRGYLIYKNTHVNQFLLFFSLFFFFSFLCCLGRCHPFFIFHFLSFFSFPILGWRCLLFLFSFFFLCLTRHDFYFLMNWVIFIFFGCLSFIYFNWPSFFNKDIWVNLDKLTFFIPPLFHFQPNKEKKN